MWISLMAGRFDAVFWTEISKRIGAEEKYCTWA